MAYWIRWTFGPDPTKLLFCFSIVLVNIVWSLLFLVNLASFHKHGCCGEAAMSLEEAIRDKGVGLLEGRCFLERPEEQQAWLLISWTC